MIGLPRRLPTAQRSSSFWTRTVAFLQRTRRNKAWAFGFSCGSGFAFFFQIKAALLQVNCDLAFVGIRESTAFPLCVGTGCTVAGQRVGKQELERLGDSKFKVNFFTCTWQCSCTFVMFLTAFSGCCFCMFSMLLY